MGIRDQDEQDEHVSAPWKTILDLVMESGVTWGKQKNSKKNFVFCSNKTFKLIKNFRISSTFQGLIHEINLIALWSLKWPNSFCFCSSGRFWYLSWAFLHLVFFFFFRRILISFQCFFLESLFVFLILLIYHFLCIQKKKNYKKIFSNFLNQNFLHQDFLLQNLLYQNFLYQNQKKFLYCK